MHIVTPMNTHMYIVLTCVA